MISKVQLTNFQVKSVSENPLPHSAKLNAKQVDSFEKQKKLNSICCLTDGWATPIMV